MSDATALTRAGLFEVERADGETRVSMALSSEMPVLRVDWRTGRPFYEVLAHDSAAVDMSRAARGLPLLLDHDHREQVGRFVNVRLGPDKKLRADAVFSRGDQGQEIAQDVADGIRVDVSVGYAVSEDYDEETREGDEYPTRTYRRWTPYEASLVAVPADPTVGVGRSAGGAAPVSNTTPGEPAGERAMETQNAPATPVSVAPSAPAGPTREQIIMDMAEAAGLGVRDARELVASDKDVREVSALVFQRVKEREAAATQPAPRVAFSAREEQTYSLVRAINALANNQRSGLEFEVSDEIAKQMGRATHGFFYPTTMAAQQRTLLSVGGTNKGAESKFTEFGSFFEQLRNRLVTARMGAQMIGGLNGDVGFVEQTAAGTATWGAETANASLSSLTLGLRTMAPKILQSATTYSRQLLRQSVIDVENLVRNDLLTIHALELDRAALVGTGLTNQPRGITNTSGVDSTVVGGATGAQPTYENVVALQRQVAAANGFDGRLGYVMSPRVAARLALTQQFASTNGVPVWAGPLTDGIVAGLPAVSSNQIPQNIVKSTSNDTGPVIFGDWSALMIGEWGAAEILVDPLTSGPAVIKVMSIQMVDVLLRYPAKFAVMPDARP